MSDGDIVERLLEMAGQVDDVPVADIEALLREAARTVGLLRDELGRMVPIVNKAAEAGILAR